MFAYIQNNQISFISESILSEKNLQNLENYKDFIVQEFSKEIKNPILENGKIIEKPIKETPAEKFARIFSYLANPENPLRKEKLEGIEFNDEQIGNLILARVFDNNPHGQTALQTKVIAMLMAKKENPELLAEILQKMEKINEIRLFF